MTNSVTYIKLLDWSADDYQKMIKALDEINVNWMVANNGEIVK